MVEIARAGYQLTEKFKGASLDEDFHFLRAVVGSQSPLRVRFRVLWSLEPQLALHVGFHVLVASQLLVRVNIHA